MVWSHAMIDREIKELKKEHKELNTIPMSTTWVFVGLLCGRELAISTMNKEYKFKYVFPLIGKDFIKMVFGLSISVGIVLAIHYIIIPNNFGM